MAVIKLADLELFYEGLGRAGGTSEFCTPEATARE